MKKVHKQYRVREPQEPYPLRKEAPSDRNVADLTFDLLLRDVIDR